MAEESYRACNCAKLYNGYTRAPNEKNRWDDKLLRQMIAAMDEGFRVLEALRYPLTPAAHASLIRKRPALMRLFTKIYHRMPISRLVDGSVGEIVALSRVFHLWKEQTRVPPPNWDELEKPFEAKVNRS